MMTDEKKKQRKLLALLLLSSIPFTAGAEDTVPALGPSSNAIQLDTPSPISPTKTQLGSASSRAAPAVKLAPTESIDHQTVGLHYGLLSAAPGTALVGQGNGTTYGIEVTSYLGNRHLHLMGRTRLSYGQGQAIFNEDSTQRNLAFRLISGEVLLGARVNLMYADVFNLTPYFGVAGKLGLNSLSLPEVPISSTTLAPTMTGKTIGIEFVSGFEIEKIFYMEFQLRSGTGSLGGISVFQLEGAAISAGFIWR